MLSLKNIDNITSDELINTQYDVAIFCSGYESRSTFLISKLNLKNITSILLFGYEEHSQEGNRVINDEIYLSYGYTPIIISSQDEKVIYRKLIEEFKKFERKKEINVLVDYTSMSRLWYSGILNFFKIQESGRVINVYLNYCLGDYDEERYLENTFSSIKSLPFHEGSLSSNNKTLLIVAAGFNPFLIKSVIEEIEPNEIIGVLPIPNLIPKHEEKSKVIQNEILINDIKNWVKCPIDNLENIFRIYAELASSNINKKDIILLSLGPKIFTLASILVGQRFEQITCLYLKTISSVIEDVNATEHFVCNKISYVSNEAI